MRDELWIKHDVRSREDWKMANFLEDAKAEGYGVFWCVIEMLHHANDHRLPLGMQIYCACARALHLHKDKVAEIIQLAINHKLWRIEQRGVERWFFSPKLDRELADKEEKLSGLSQKRREAANARWQKSTNDVSGLHANAMQNDFAHANDAREKREKREKRIDNKKHDEEIKFPEKWGPVSQSTFQKWIEYRQELKKPLKSKSAQSQIDHFADDPKKFCQLVERAILNGWQGLNEQVSFDAPSKNGFPASNGKPTTCADTVQHNLKYYREKYGQEDDSATVDTGIDPIQGDENRR